MTRYEQVGGGGVAFIDDKAVIGFLTHGQGYTAVLTTAGRVEVVGDTNDLYDAWSLRRRGPSGSSQPMRR